MSDQLDLAREVDWAWSVTGQFAVEADEWEREADRERARAEAAEAKLEKYLRHLEQRDTLLASLQDWFYENGDADMVAIIAEVFLSTWEDELPAQALKAAPVPEEATGDAK